LALYCGAIIFRAIGFDELVEELDAEAALPGLLKSIVRAR
jgi:hypothetical protein